MMHMEEIFKLPVCNIYRDVVTMYFLKAVFNTIAGIID